jgi:hypothetical protein
VNSGLSLFGAFVFLVAGVTFQTLLERFVYPLLSRAHERAKVMGRHKIDPSRVMLILRIVNFLLLPVVGLFAGGALFNR